MRVKLIKNVLIGDERYSAGSTEEILEPLAGSLISQGLATEIVAKSGENAEITAKNTEKTANSEQKTDKKVKKDKK